MALVHNNLKHPIPLTVGYLGADEERNIDISGSWEQQLITNGVLTQVDNTAPPAPVEPLASTPRELFAALTQPAGLTRGDVWLDKTAGVFREVQADGSLAPLTVGSGIVAAWAPTTVYKAGQLVTNAGLTWQALADFTSGGAFNAANWRQIQTGADLASLALPTAAVYESIPRNYGLDHITTGGTGGSPLVSGTLQLAICTLAKGDVVNVAKVDIGSTAAATQTNAWACITDAAGSVLAKSVDRAAATLTADSLITFDFTAAPFVAPADGVYYFGICVVAGTLPSMRGRNSHSSVTAQAPRSCARANTGLTDPASLGASTIAFTAAAFQPYFALYS